MEHREVLDRLSPYLDDELDPVASREIAAHLASCPSCAAALARERELSAALRTELEYHRAPDLLRARVRRDLRATAEVRPRGPARLWQWAGAAAAIAVVAGGTWLAVLATQGRGVDALEREAVSDHVRSLMANHLADVASTDQHTVKPWFSGRLDFSPPVTDFAAAGYPLIGGRLDYLDGRSVAALVYQRRKHIINVFVWPTSDGRAAISPAATRQGFNVIRATRANMAFCLVSDLNAEELDALAKLIAEPTAQP